MTYGYLQGIRGVFTLLCLAFAPVTPLKAESTSALGVSLANNIYRPAFDEFNQATDRLLSSIDALCLVGTSTLLSQARASFVKAVRTYSVIEVFTVGAMLQNNRNNRLFFWPDTRRAGERQLRSLLASKTLHELNADLLSEKSVAVQGMGALERLLFDNAAEKELMSPVGSRCTLAKVVVRNIHALSVELTRAWQVDSLFTKELLSPRSDSEFFRTEVEIKRSVVTQATTALSVLSMRKIPLLVRAGDQSEQEWSRQVRKLPFWKSAATLASIEGNLRGVQLLLSNPELQIPDALRNEIAFELRNAFNYLNDESVVSVVVNRGEYTEAAGDLINGALVSVVSSLQTTAAERVAGSLGVSQGFNSEDGD